MTLQQGIEIAKLAKAKGYATRAKSGKIQFVIVEYTANGKSVVLPITEWLDYVEAMQIIHG